MKKLVDGIEVGMSADEEKEFLKASPSVVMGSYSLYKTTFWMRLTDDEAEKVMTAKNSQPAKLRGMWDDSLMIQSNSEFFGALKSLISSTLSPKRADELLAREDG